MRIAVDLDDVVIEFVKPFIEHYNHVYGETYKYEDIHYWNLYETLVQLETSEGMKAFINAFIYHPHYRKLPAVPGALKGIRQLIDDGHEIYFITSRSSKAIDETYKWLHANGLPIDKIFFNKDKGWLCKTLNIDIHIDDGIHNLENIGKESPYTALVVYDRPWNQYITPNHIHDRVKNWEQFLKLIKEMEKMDERN
jgi:5'(3')-deoxyribonucleotidase